MNIKRNNIMKRAYILMRIFQEGNGPSSLLESSLKSIGIQTYENICLLAYVDRWYNEDTKKSIQRTISNFIGNDAVNVEIELNTSGRNSSAFGSYHLRKRFLKITGDQQDAVCITLDQDDRLFNSSSIANIMKTFHRSSSAGPAVCLLDFIEEKDGIKVRNSHKDHSTVLRRLSLIPSWPCLKFLRRSGLYMADTLMWTKAYNREAMYLLMQKLDSCSDIKTILVKYPTYEDFLDHLILLDHSVRILNIRNNRPTHIYLRHASSITCSPHVEEFRQNRVKYLGLVCRLHLSSGSDTPVKELFAFLVYKVYRIETIMERLRLMFEEEGQEQYYEFSLVPHKESFTDLVGAEIRDSIPQEDYNRLAMHRDKGNGGSSLADSLYWAARGLRSRKSRIEKNNLRKRFLRFKDTLVSTMSYMLAGIVIWLVLGLICSYVLYLTNSGGVFQRPYCTIFRDTLTDILPIFTAIFTAFAGFEISKSTRNKDILRGQEIFDGELSDCIRHLEANIRVLLEIRHQLGSVLTDSRPDPVHFANLPLPEDSMLLTNKAAEMDNTGDLQYIFRLKTNLRNISNSAVALQEYAKSPNYTRDNMIKLLDWEISRNFGYFSNFWFVKLNHRFPEPAELDIFMDEQFIYNKFYRLFMNVYNFDLTKSGGFEAIKEMAAKYIDGYKKDRRLQRDVIIYE